MPFGGLLSVGVGLAGKAVLGAIQNHKASQIHPQYTPYVPSQYAKDNLATAQNAYNGRMAGAPYLEQNILANQANQNANIDRSATDGGQVLAAKAGAQGQTNAGFEHLQAQEAMNKYGLLNNLNLANSAMTQEGDKTYQANLQKYSMDAQQQNALRQSGITNVFGAVNGVGSAAMMKMMMGKMPKSTTAAGGQTAPAGSDIQSILPYLMMMGGGVN